MQGPPQTHFFSFPLLFLPPLSETPHLVVASSITLWASCRRLEFEIAWTDLTDLKKKAFKKKKRFYCQCVLGQLLLCFC